MKVKFFIPGWPKPKSIKEPQAIGKVLSMEETDAGLYVTMQIDDPAIQEKIGLTNFSMLSLHGVAHVDEPLPWWRRWYDKI